MKKRMVVAMGLMVILSLSVWGGGVSAAEYPSKTIEFICASTPGADSDFNVRTLAKYLTKELGANVVATNIAGAGGALATDEFIHSPNDGYRLYMNHSMLHTATAFGMSDYAWYDMEPVCIFGWGTGEVVFARSDFPANTMKELIEISQKEPGKYKLGYSAGATSHYLAVKLMQYGAKFNNVTTGNAAERVVGVKGGHIDVGPAGIMNIIDYVKNGEFKIIANCASRRSPSFPDVKTVKEQGYDISFDPSYTLYAVKGTDPKIIKKLEQTCRKIVMENKEYQAEIAKAYAQEPYFEDAATAKVTLKAQLDAFMAIKDELRKGLK